MSRQTQLRLQLCGWILFVFSALFFMASSLRAGDPVSLIGGLLFLLACFVFMLPLLAELRVPADSALNTRGPRRKYSRYPSDWFRAAHCLSRAPAARRTTRGRAINKSL